MNLTKTLNSNEYRQKAYKLLFAISDPTEKMVDSETYRKLESRTVVMPTRRGTPEVNQMKGFNTVIIDLYYGTLYVLIMGGSTLLPFVNEGTVTEYEKNW